MASPATHKGAQNSALLLGTITLPVFPNPPAPAKHFRGSSGHPLNTLQIPSCLASACVHLLHRQAWRKRHLRGDLRWHSRSCPVLSLSGYTWYDPKAILWAKAYLKQVFVVPRPSSIAPGLKDTYKWQSPRESHQLRESEVFLMGQIHLGWVSLLLVWAHPLAQAPAGLSGHCHQLIGEMRLGWRWGFLAGNSPSLIQ